MSNSIDCRGMKCPLPVITVKKALEKAADDKLSVIVDNDIAKSNVLKLANSSGCETTVEQLGSDWVITLLCGQGVKSVIDQMAEQQPEADTRQSTVVYLITSDVLGDGDAELGRVLMRSLLFTISERPAPKALIFMNKGVFLTCVGSSYIELLQKIADNGAEILSCGTCLDFYNLKEKLAVGEPGNMFSALELLEVNRVIKI